MSEYNRSNWLHGSNITEPCKCRPDSGVWCDRLSKCETCGWNYEVEAQRKERIRHEAEKEVWLIGNGSFD